MRTTHCTVTNKQITDLLQSSTESEGRLRYVRRHYHSMRRLFAQIRHQLVTPLGFSHVEWVLPLSHIKDVRQLIASRLYKLSKYIFTQHCGFAPITLNRRLPKAINVLRYRYNKNSMINESVRELCDQHTEARKFIQNQYLFSSYWYMCSLHVRVTHLVNKYRHKDIPNVNRLKLD